MKEVTIRNDIKHAFMEVLNVNVWHPVDVRATPGARPDLVIISPIGGGIIEVKRFAQGQRVQSFACTHISDSQRKLLDFYTTWHHGMAWFGIGTQPQIGKKRKIWVIPWLEYTAWEREILRTKKSFRASEMEARFPEWELAREDGRWRLTARHEATFISQRVRAGFDAKFRPKKAKRFSVLFEEE